MGDLGTAIFYRSVQLTDKYNSIQALQLEDKSWFSDHGTISSLFVNYFSTLFNPIAPATGVDSQNYDPWFSGLLSLQPNHHSILLAQVTNEEIYHAAFNMHSLKSSRADGVSPLLFKSHWTLVGDQTC